jgi:hypothetical protein
VNKYFPFFIDRREAAGGGVGGRDVVEFSPFLTVGFDGAESGSFFIFLSVKDFEGLPLDFLASWVAGEDLVFTALA